MTGLFVFSYFILRCSGSFPNGIDSVKWTAALGIALCQKRWPINFSVGASNQSFSIWLLKRI
jgi:hypothetical protein